MRASGAKKSAAELSKERAEVLSAISRIFVKKASQSTLPVPTSPSSILDPPAPIPASPSQIPKQTQAPPKLPFKQTVKNKPRSQIQKPQSGLDDKMYLDFYKTLEEQDLICPGTRCRFWHRSCDRRRRTDKYAYVAEMCPTAENCPLLDFCVFAHNPIELEFHPDRYKSIQCEDPSCPQDIHCPNLHPGETYLRVKAKEPHIGTALATLNLLLPERCFSNYQESSKTHLVRTEAQIETLKQQLSCKVCFKELARFIWVPCGHAVCVNCTQEGSCTKDSNSQLLKLNL